MPQAHRGTEGVVFSCGVVIINDARRQMPLFFVKFIPRVLKVAMVSRKGLQLTI